MNQALLPVENRLSPDTTLALQNRLAAFARGDLGADSLASEISRLSTDGPGATHDIIRFIEDWSKQGELSPDARRDLESKVLSAGSRAGHYGTTVDLDSAAHREPCDIGVGRVLRDRYILTQQLGCGGMGSVFKALDRYRSDLPEAQQYVAIKILHGGSERRAVLLANLRREFHCVQTLSHRNIVKVYELDNDGDIAFFTMEYLDGELLSSVIERMQPAPMPRAFAWRIIRELGSGLAHAHARNVIHADLKPHNIMITQSGEIRILDFGASSSAQRSSSAPSEANEPEGQQRHSRSSVTPAYACCELLAGRPPDPSDDIYAYACVAYELLAGTHPFQRRPSTEARNLGIIPKRPTGLTRQQWRTLVMGLSWHRAGRSIPVRVWLNRLHAGREAADTLPPATDLKPAPVPPRYAGHVRAATLCAVLVVTALIGLLFIRSAPGGRSGVDTVVPTAAANKTLDAEAAAQVADPGDKPAAGLTSKDEPPAPAHPSAVPGTVRDTESAAALPSPSKRETARLRPMTPAVNPLRVSASNYRIHTGDHFAEIRVRRAALTRSDAAFTWWTEAASAKPGIDYVHQGKVTQVFPKGKNSTTFFVKLLPTKARSQREVFYIAIAEAGHGSSTGQVARAAVWLPTNHDAS